MARTPKRWLNRDWSSEGLRSSDIAFSPYTTIQTAITDISGSSLTSQSYVTILSAQVDQLDQYVNSMSGVFVISGDITNRIPLSGSDQIAGNLIPFTSGVYTLGNSTYGWKDVFVTPYGSVKQTFSDISGTLSSYMYTDTNALNSLSSSITGKLDTSIYQNASGNWEGTYTTLAANSATWGNEAADINYLSAQINTKLSTTNYGFQYIFAQPSGHLYPGVKGQRYCTPTSGATLTMYECVATNFWVHWTVSKTP